MSRWTKGNSPQKPGTYFITINRNGKPYVPWEIYSYNGATWSRESKYHQCLDRRRILAYMSISVPDAFIPATAEKNEVVCYFVRVDYGDGRISEYGLRGWPRDSYSNNGFDCLGKARAALYRRRNKDLEYGYDNFQYSVIDNLGNVIGKRAGKRGENEK